MVAGVQLLDLVGVASFLLIMERWASQLQRQSAQVQKLILVLFRAIASKQDSLKYDHLIAISLCCGVWVGKGRQ